MDGSGQLPRARATVQQRRQLLHRSRRQHPGSRLDGIRSHDRLLRAQLGHTRAHPSRLRRHRREQTGRRLALRLAREATASRTTSSARSWGSPKSCRAGYNPIDAFYPGGPFQSIGYPDIEKSVLRRGSHPRALRSALVRVHDAAERSHAGRSTPARPLRRRCSPSTTKPRACSIDALSHSPLWKSTLVDHHRRRPAARRRPRGLSPRSHRLRVAVGEASTTCRRPT